MSIQIGSVNLTKNTLRQTIPMEIAPVLHIVQVPLEAKFIRVIQTTPSRQDRFTIYYESDPATRSEEYRLIGIGAHGNIIDPPGLRTPILIDMCSIGSDLSGRADLFFYDLGEVYDDA